MHCLRAKRVRRELNHLRLPSYPLCCFPSKCMRDTTMPNKYSIKKVRYIGLGVLIISFLIQVFSNYLNGIPSHGDASTLADTLYFSSTLFFIFATRFLFFGLKLSKRIFLSMVFTLIFLPILNIAANLFHILRACPCSDAALGYALLFVLIIIPSTVLSGLIALIPEKRYVGN